MARERPEENHGAQAVVSLPEAGETINNDPRLLTRLRREYEQSLDTLRPIKAQFAHPTGLIDQVVFRLSRLKEEKIAGAEGRS